LPPAGAAPARPGGHGGRLSGSAASRRGSAELPAGVALHEAQGASAGLRLHNFDLPALREEFRKQGSFLFIPRLLPAEVTEELIAAVAAVETTVNRNYLPGHKQGGSVSRHAIDQLAPAVAALYKRPELIEWLAELAGQRLQWSPPDDPHAYAL